MTAKDPPALPQNSQEESKVATVGIAGGGACLPKFNERRDGCARNSMVGHHQGDTEKSLPMNQDAFGMRSIVYRYCQVRQAIQPAITQVADSEHRTTVDDRRATPLEEACPRPSRPQHANWMVCNSHQVRKTPQAPPRLPRGVTPQEASA